MTLDSWGILKGGSIFWDGQGKMLSQKGHLRYQAVLFDACTLCERPVKELLNGERKSREYGCTNERF